MSKGGNLDAMLVRLATRGAGDPSGYISSRRPQVTNSCFAKAIHDARLVKILEASRRQGMMAALYERQ